MAVSILKWAVVIIALINTGYMTYDGARAILTGDYIRPKTGEYAGQLGPWTKLAEKAGIDPMSTLMKSIFILFGVAGLIVTICFAMDVHWAWKAMLIYNICSLWNLFFGAASSILQIILLIIIRLIR
jgi:hypothetical protein